MDFDSQLSALIDLAFAEDGSRDVTSELLFDAEEEKEGVISAKQDGIVAGFNCLEKIAAKIDDSMVIEPFLDEGDEVKNRMMVAGMNGKVVSLLRVERVLLNFLSRMSGIATMARQFVDAVEGTGAVILDTRKTVPGWRYLDKYAVTVGGGINHRMNLEDVAIIKDVHVDAAGGVEKAVLQFRGQEAERPLIVEVRDLKELDEALSQAKSLTRIMLDNFSVEQMQEAVDLASGRILLEASGNITLDNARAVAETGVHFLSIGALTHSVQAFDYSFQISS